MKKFDRKPYTPIPAPEDEQPFLDKDSSSNDDCSRAFTASIRDTKDLVPFRTNKVVNFVPIAWDYSRSSRSLLFLSLLNLALMLSNVFWNINTGVWLDSMRRWCPDTPSSPLISGIRYEHKLLDNGHEHDPFVGEYRQEMIDAWWDIKKKAFFRASKKEMIEWGEFGDDSVPLSNGGYMAGFRVHHELSCLEWLKMEYSNPNVTLDPGYEADYFGIILQGVQCRGDVNTHSWYLGDAGPDKPLIAVPNQPHLCVNWDSVEEWIRPRQLEEVGRVHEPAIGPDGELISQVDLSTYSIPH